MDQRDLEDQMTVLAAIQQRHAETMKSLADEIDTMRKQTNAARERVDQMERELATMRETSEQRMSEWERRIEALVSGFGAFLRDHQKPA